MNIVLKMNTRAPAASSNFFIRWILPPERRNKKFLYIKKSQPPFRAIGIFWQRIVAGVRAAILLNSGYISIPKIIAAA